MATESIPGCVLQLYVWLTNPKEAGTYALVSIVISAMTTGFTSAMMAFDFDVDVPHRKNQPDFYGYIPDDTAVRARCFVLMTMISGLHNVSRSIGCALLAVGDDKVKILYFIGGEMVLYLLYKTARGDYYDWIPLHGVGAIVQAFWKRSLVKVIVDFSGCLQMRHPYVASERTNERTSERAVRTPAGATMKRSMLFSLFLFF